MATDGLLIPVRRSAPAGGQFKVTPDVTIASRLDISAAQQQLADDLAAHHVRLQPVEASEAAIRILRDRQIRGPEAYRLVVSPRGCEIRASGPAGAYYGLQTLRALLRSNKNGAIPACRIDDAPDFRRRGVSLDISRGRVPKMSRLMQLVEVLAHWKVNELQLYVENVFRFRKHPEIGRGYSPLTPDDIRRLQDHCRRHHIRLVGSFASFGHMEKILQIPRYSSLGEMQGFRDWPGGTTLCPHDPGSIRLIADLYGEYLPLFEANDFNVSGDEPWELGQGRSVVRARWFGIGGVYMQFMNKLHDVCRHHGKRANAWADFILLHPEIIRHVPRDMVMLNWDYEPDGPNIRKTRRLVDAGLRVVVCPGTQGWLAHGGRIEYGIRNIERFAAEGLACGVDGLLNTDWGDNGHRNLLAVSMHNLAWGAAHAWCHRRTQERGFTERFCRDTFGVANPKLPRAIRTLGATFPTPEKYRNLSFLYSVLCPAVQAGFEYMEFSMDTLPYVLTRDLEDRARRMDALAWPSAMDSGERASAADPALAVELLQEFAIATRLERLAARRALALKRAGEGRAVRTSTWKQLMEETNATAAELRRVWLLGNRPSRLRDVMASMQKTIDDYALFARGRGAISGSR